MTFNVGDRVMVRPTVARAYIPDPDHGNAILITGEEVTWSPYWAAMLSQGAILAVLSSSVPPVTSALIYSQAQLDAAVAAAVAPLQAQIAVLQAQTATGPSSGTPPSASTNTLHPTFAAFGLLGAATN